ncbi:LCP family protein [Allorhizocola rhizosphaerae]|uniref:LCP family protein n=1 Tax=Allorhizocola rhizosphaerae TaxID=1872709 RepID=UPI000E3DCEB8|nr:LCP family protein [Allorhizocola rhizosphaerae]
MSSAFVTTKSRKPELLPPPPPLPEPPPPRGKRRKAWWARLLVAAGTLLVLTSGGVMIAVKVALDRAVSSVTQVEIPSDPENTSVVPEGRALTGTLNILLVGVDDGQAVGGELRKDTPLADSIMILHVPPSRDRAYLVSLPRDLWVRIPGHGSGKLNSAYTDGHREAKAGNGRAGGLDLLMRTISGELGIVFNAAAIVNFTGFTKAVNLLGGVTMYIDERVESVHYGTTADGQLCYPARFDSEYHAHKRPGCTPRVFERGTRRLTAEEALDYTRQREWLELEDGDYGRQRHQQQFIKALVREARLQGLTTDLPKALRLIESVGSALTVWTNGVKLEDWFFTLKDLAAGDIFMVKTNRGAYNPAPISGTAAEALSEDSRQMFAALRDNRIHEWLVDHPDWLGSEQGY